MHNKKSNLFLEKFCVYKIVLKIFIFQVLALADIYKRELSVPLLGMENTYAEWKIWIASLPEGLVDSNLVSTASNMWIILLLVYGSKQVEYGYNNARKTLEVYKPFEDQLLVVQSNEELLNTYREYIKHVTDPSTIICVYERAAAQLCLVPGNCNFFS